MATANAAAGLMAGDVLPPELGKYRVLRELGRGGMGVVFLAEDTSLCREIALKAIFPQFSADTVFLQRFQAEARALASFSHQGIVRINSLENIAGRMLIDMEYIQGISMADQLALGALPATRAVEIAALVLQALAACHARGITHRDIKPNNILLEHTGRVVLTDFGLSQAFAAVLEETITRSSSSGFFQGTPRYAPPEAWDGVPATPAWDLFSVGAILYEAIVGRPVYSGTTPMAIMKQVLVYDAVDFGGVQVSQELRTLIGDLLARDPAVRPQSALECLKRLAATPEGGGLRVDTAVQLSWAPKPRRKLPLPTRKSMARSGLGLLLLAILALVYMAPRPARENAAAPAIDETTPLQTEVLAEGLVDQATLLTLRRFETPARTVAVELMEGDSATQAQGLLTDPTAASPRITVFSRSGLWSIQLAKDATDAATIQGDWADYVVTQGMLLRRGQISGKGHGDLAVATFTANLKLHNERDNSDRVVTFSMHPVAQSDAQFVYAFESEPLAQRLLWKELLPRRLPWAIEMEAMLPWQAGARVAAPQVVDPGDEFKLDGLLTDTLWTSRFYDDEQGRVGELAGFPARAKVGMSLRCSPVALYLGVTLPPEAAEVTLAISPPTYGPEVPELRQELHVSTQGTDAHAFRAGKEIAWTPDWQAALKPGAIEFRIPLAALGMPTPGEFDCLRFVLIAADKDGTPATAWGGTRTEDAAHGVLVHFAQAKVSAP